MKDVTMLGISSPTSTHSSRTQSQAELEGQGPCKRMRLHREEEHCSSMQIEGVAPQMNLPPARSEDEVLIQVRVGEDDLQRCDCIFCGP